MAKKRIINKTAKLSKKTNAARDSHIVEITINNHDQKIDYGHIMILLANRFSLTTSPVKSLYIKPIIGTTTRRGDTIDREVTGLQIAEVIQQSPFVSIVLARINIETYPYQLVILIAAKKDELQNREKVETIAKEIVSELLKKKFEIETVVPANLLEHTSRPPWEQIPDHYADRAILELWHKGYTNNDIGTNVHLTKLRVTNILYELRKKYGKEIVPTNIQ